MKVLALIDVQSLFLDCREEFGPLARIDYVKLANKLSSYGNVDKVAYVLQSPYHDDRKFQKFLKKQNFFVMRRIPEIVKINDETHARSWVDDMVWEAIKMLPSYDKIVIVSGNGNFCSVADAAHAHNKTIHILSFNGSLNSKLAKTVDTVEYMDQTYLFDPSQIAK